METEEQQIEQLKTFWNEHGKGIVAGLVIGFALFYGWRYYDAQTVAAQEAQSEQYQQIVVQLETDGEAALTAAKQFVENEKGSTYATLAAFELAQDAVNKGDLETAITALQTARDHQSGALKFVADLRQARLLLAQQNYDAALNALTEVSTAAGFASKAAELRGDILLEQGDTSGARQAYQDAIAAAEDDGSTVLVETKLNSIPAAS
ncbi:YfgM family protein [Pseudidiomarina terrestris]|uniref:Ancillary SecYEG translocon subunit n=1 Tax=Pseudidiomarina terrestris TaxID=2820060 RepID=A0AAW7QX27_9GAMM|nr:MULTISPECIES: tetratricopeptide repeat protein [unclassified Pseudidiomarina]MDN7124438.1 tetratricopeptide repeat protein [Pseudidiomarina sp. 1APP75-32.1]MDN7127007.1 tetratricopeptide repeat protein [Pseudidiomarina sp. 1APR75-33.1]MDN7129271.1 tetratricopeptide repeat protein [Pseudidiomarina sp. 1APR75-15]MDN7134463.1 tetratricopeptide repeat protein [Pseudidiomarina sp. 1ASP75-5]MDN7136848.1 tetratricopeptide repeat protein [Pseudidiomarina sp. 1ASP75-14]